MNELVTINNHELPVKEYNGQRVVTLKEIDTVHDRPEGTARRTFHSNKKHLIEGEDFFVRNPSEAAKEFGIIAPNGLVLLTESGYLMLVKSFTDDLAWAVQRQLVNTYFRVGHSPDMSDLSPELRLLIKMELKQKEQDLAIQAVNQKVDDIREVVSANSQNWRESCRRLLAKVANFRGGGGAYQEVNAEVFKQVDERAKVALDTRLTNKRRRMADEGVCKSKRDRLTKVDVIAEDPKLIEIYVAIVKETAIHDGISLDKEEF